MTAYLQPGDKIHLNVPGYTDTQNMDRINAVRGYYQELGIEIFLITEINGVQSTIEVVSAIRAEKARAPVDHAPANPAAWPDLH
jgi:hypothetical protein